MLVENCERCIDFVGLEADVKLRFSLCRQRTSMRRPFAFLPDYAAANERRELR
jgi:hypothetical protein